MDFFFYIFECVDGSFYIGYIDDLDKWMEQYDLGLGCVYIVRWWLVKLIYM